jgi:chromosome segregation ATPase
MNNEHKKQLNDLLISAKSMPKSLGQQIEELGEQAANLEREAEILLAQIGAIRSTRWSLIVNNPNLEEAIYNLLYYDGTKDSKDIPEYFRKHPDKAKIKETLREMRIAGRIGAGYHIGTTCAVRSKVKDNDGA